MSKYDANTVIGAFTIAIIGIMQWLDCVTKKTERMDG